MAQQANTITESDEKNVSSAIQAKIADGMMEVFDMVVSDRTRHFEKHPDKIPDKAAAPSIINKYSAANAAVSGGAGLVPGPWGMLAVVPEITIVIRNQLAMIYDVGMAYGQSKVLSKELLAGVLISAMGTSAGALLVMHGQKVLVKRVALRQFQRIITMLAGNIAQKVLKLAIGKWLPVVGAAALAVWSNVLTRQIGKKALEIFEMEIELSEEVVDEEFEDISNGPIAAAVNLVSDTNSSPDLPKVQALINLMTADGTVKSQEREYIETIIGNADLTVSEKSGLTQAIETNGKFTVDYSAFASSPDDAIGLLVDLIALAKRDGTFHITEKMFVKQVGKLLGFSETDIDEAMAMTN